MRTAGTAVVLVLLAVALVGCASNPARVSAPKASSLESPPTPRIESMPNVVGKDVDSAAEPLHAAGLKVVVLLPKRIVSTLDATPTQRAGIASQTIVLPETQQPWNSGTRWLEPVISQRPAPGAPLSMGTTITLVAGRHPGGDPKRPWVWEHQGAVKARGAAPCLDQGCHAESRCSDCHTSIRPAHP